MGALEKLEEGRRESEALSAELMRLARSSLIVNLRFLDRAISLLKPVPGDRKLAFSGQGLIYEPSYILKLAREEMNRPSRDYLHVVLHGIFRHKFVGRDIDRRLWNLASDIAAENIINELELPCTLSRRSSLQIPLYSEIASRVRTMTAEHIYHLLVTEPFGEERLKLLEEVSRADEHDIWYERVFQEKKTENSVRSGQPQGETEDPEASDKKNKETEGNEKSISRRQMAEEERRREEETWKDISAHIQGDLESFSRNRGERAGSLIRGLRELNREKRDYGSFLKKFAVRGEALGINPDEFDYLFYTYGLQLYDNMPLIEPLEYRDVKRIREFVIAIDSSGSISKKAVTDFVGTTFRILKNTESFFKKIRCRIIFCDAAVQGEYLIERPEEAEKLTEHLEIKGSGGTDFRPVFERISELRKSHEIRHMGGLLYFTDGEGIFPGAAPDYPAAFVFNEEPDPETVFPPWAIRHVLTSGWKIAETGGSTSGI